MFLSTQICIHVHTGTHITRHITYPSSVHTKPRSCLSHIARYTACSARYIELPGGTAYLSLENFLNGIRELLFPHTVYICTHQLRMLLTCNIFMGSVFKGTSRIGTI
jgi:hypothetical protein